MQPLKMDSKFFDVKAAIARREKMTPEERVAEDARIEAENAAGWEMLERERTERAHLDYLARLKSQVPALFQGRRFDDLIPVPANQRALETARTWLTTAEDNLYHGRGFWVIGPPGCGKTSIVAAMLYSLPTKASMYRKGKGRKMTTAYVNWARFVCDLNIRLRQEENEKLEALMRSAELLVIDDIGAEENNRISRSMAYAVIDYRYSNQLPVFVASNLTPDEMGASVGERVVDRLCEMIPKHYRTAIVGESFRRNPEQLRMPK